MNPLSEVDDVRVAKLVHAAQRPQDAIHRVVDREQAEPTAEVRLQVEAGLATDRRIPQEGRLVAHVAR